MIISLHEIPPSGKHFICNNLTAELNEILHDLIGKTPYQIEFTIQPQFLKTNFELTGFIKTEVPDECSRCGIDFNISLDKKIKELLIPELEQPRNSKYAKTSPLSDLDKDNSSVIEYKNGSFDAGEYFHEVIAMEIPYVPAPEKDEKGNCSFCGKNLNSCTFGYEDKGFDKPISPFAGALRNLKGISNK